MDMDIQKYLTFIKTVEYSSFTKAAEKLSYSQSGISRMINDLEQDKLLVVLPESHPLADCKLFPVKALCDYPFMLLEKGAKAEISEIFENNNLIPKTHFTTWDDYAIMSMVESGLGISILPKLTACFVSNCNKRIEHTSIS